jgi:glyoxylase-like metal-dependent hydrolase (beta-lactamase superfamily II)
VGGEPVIEQVAPGVYRIESDLGPRFMCQYLLVGEDASLLVDTGLAETPAAVLDPALEELGVEPTIVLISHADVDHCGGNRALGAAHPAALFACHELDRRWVEGNEAMLLENYCWYEQHGFGIEDEAKASIRRDLGGDAPIDVGLRGAESIRLGPGWRVEVVHLPGHTPGHVGIWDARNRAAIIIDAVLEDGIYDRAGRRLIPPRIYDLAAYRDTIERVRALEPELLLTAHYPVLARDEARGFLDRSLRFSEELEELVRESVERGMTGLKELTEAADARLGPYPEFAVELGASVRACLA